MRTNAATLLTQLVRIKDDYSPSAGDRKLELIHILDRRRLPTAKAVYEFHEVLSFLHAYPDNARVHARAEATLKRFARRSDLRRFAAKLTDTGIEGTPTGYSFYWSTARWLEKRWGGNLSISWNGLNEEKLWGVLYALLPFTETLALDDAEIDVRGLLEILKRPDETDAGFLIRRVAKSLGREDTREIVFEDMDITFRIAPGPGTPTRTAARYRPSPVRFQTRPLDRSRPDLTQAVRVPPVAVRAVTPREGRRLIDMARTAMVARSRDLYVFEHPDENDVRMVDCGDGLQFVAIGLVPEHRLMLDTIYGFLTLKNGVPIGYVLTRSYFGSCEVAYNVFETFRGGESAYIYGRALAMARHLFGGDVFTVDPYQMGHENTEGLKSGAWWFYYKLGFRPLDPDVKRLLRAELAEMRRNPAHRSSLSTLNELSSRNMFLFLGKQREDVAGLIPMSDIGLAVSHYLARRFGSDRERAVRVCEREVGQLLGVKSLRGLSAGERLAWRRWCPLIMALPGVATWPLHERRALALIARAKGGRRESDYVSRFDAHRKLRRALFKLAANAPSA
ncbi:MAG TPA: hypothetical protein VFX92_05540 [Candidatus Krumholzibacteria bacterium]|nr:hypothetical protein [Candidatus Krumholzibacteria bacterium]